MGGSDEVQILPLDDSLAYQRRVRYATASFPAVRGAFVRPGEALELPSEPVQLGGDLLAVERYASQPDRPGA